MYKIYEAGNTEPFTCVHIFSRLLLPYSSYQVHILTNSSLNLPGYLFFSRKTQVSFCRPYETQYKTIINHTNTVNTKELSQHSHLRETHKVH